uniref:Uncharacterized protein n=1 Tax=Peromyscus maniculatus bairdii TaxID=230844 RepID=A0A8C8UHH1_PERMB
MAGSYHLASDFAFSPPPGRGDGSGGLDFQGPPGEPGIMPGVEPGSEMLGLSPCLLSQEFCGGMAYCGPQVGLGLMLQVDLDTLQPEDQAGTGLESNSEGTFPGPCTVSSSDMKLEVKPSPQESQDMTATQRN